MKVVKTLGKGMVPRAGVEPARPFGQRILSPQRLPFRHPGMLSVTRILPSLSAFLLIINTVTLITWCVEHAGLPFQFFARVSLPSHLLKTLGLAKNSPVKSNARYGVPSAGELSQTA